MWQLSQPWALPDPHDIELVLASYGREVVLELWTNKDVALRLVSRTPMGLDFFWKLDWDGDV